MSQQMNINAAAIAALEHDETRLAAQLDNLTKCLEEMLAKSPEIQLAIEIERSVGRSKGLLAGVQQSRQQLQDQTATHLKEPQSVIEGLQRKLHEEDYGVAWLQYQMCHGPQTFALNKAAYDHNSKITDLNAPLLPLGVKGIPHPPGFPATAQDLKEMEDEELEKLLSLFGVPLHVGDNLNSRSALCLLIGVFSMLDKILE